MEMHTSAEQFHHGNLNMNPKKGADKRLFIDLDICSSGECQDCNLKCSYYYHENNNGIYSVAELATFILVCRKCEEPHCVNACPEDALEQQQKLYDQALKEFKASPDNPETIVWLGRRTAYLGRHREAIAIFTYGIQKFPNDPQMYRHRGHRFITISLIHLLT